MNFREKLVAENENFRVYTNFFTETSTHHAVRSLGEGYQVILIETIKDGSSEYVLAKDNDVIYANRRIDHIDAHIDMLRISESFK